MAVLPQSYRPTARILHWVVAVAVFAMVPAGLVMTGSNIGRPLQDALFLFHKNTGVLLLLLVLARLAYRARHPAPPLPAGMPAWQAALAIGNHAALYTLLLVMILTGYVSVRAGGYPVELLDAIGLPPLVPRSDALANLASGLHDSAKTVLIVFIALHVAAALYHGIVRRDGVLWRMRPW
ncbi:cytochrome b [Aureimonas frigidaquae]|uniref:Cytochrome B561 n=1 Tax=Aureimonas frigidaquae TaxID=424757 RepID=A0A0N7KY52_9HYPH|nr:cytochrome b/b6 domain-containing protein [Aureimonas frigidaquae]BAT28753.1 cytochrome B561 [Aureimonas frigidaquae]